MQKTPELIAHLNTLGIADVELKNNNVVKIHFQQGVSQKTWSKKELTDICTAFCAGSSSVINLLNDNFKKDFINGQYNESIDAVTDALFRTIKFKVGLGAEPSKKQVADFWGTVAAKPDPEPAPVERLG